MGTSPDDLSGLAAQDNPVQPVASAVRRPSAGVPDDEEYDPLEDMDLTNPSIQGAHALAQWRHAHRR